MGPSALSFDFEQLRRDTSWVRGVVRGMVFDESTVDDVVQDVVVEALACPPREPERLRAWFVTVARHMVRKRRERDQSRARRERTVARAESVPATDDIVARAEMARRIADAVLALTEPSRSAVLLRYFDDLPPREIARRLDVEVETVRSRIKAGLAVLRGRLEREFRGDRRALGLALSLVLAGTRVPGAKSLGPAVLTAEILRWIGGGLLLLFGVVTVLWSIRAGSVGRPEEQDRATRKESPVVTSQLGTAGSGREATRASGSVSADPPVPREHSVYGTVRNATGDPLEGARVRALRREPGYDIRYIELGRAWTEVNGRYSMGPLEGEFIVEAAAEGHFTARRPAMPGMRRDFDLGRPGILEGRITIGYERPAAGVLVALMAYGRAMPFDRHFRWVLHRWNPGRLARSDDDGRYRFTDLPPGYYHLFALPREYTASWVYRRTVRAGEETRVDVKVGGTGRLLGRIYSGSGDDRASPIVGALVYLGSIQQRATSGPGGYYEIRGLVPTITYTVRASATGHQEVSYSFTAPTAPDHELDFHLEPAGVIRGRVTDSCGIGLAGACVRLDADEREHRDLPTVKTGDHGEFRLPVTLDVPEVRLCASARGFAWAVSPPMAVEPGRSSVPLVLTLSKGATLQGMVRDAGGEPAVGVFVGLRQGQRLRARTCSLEDGRYRFVHVPRGRYELELRPWDALETDRSVYVRSLRDNVVVPDDGVLEIDCALRRGTVIAGRVIGMNGRPIENARVWALKGSDFEASQNPDDEMDRRMAFTDPQGRFTITGIRDDVGPFSLGIYHDDYLDEPCNNVEPGMRELLVTLQRRLHLKGRVFLAGSGRPVSRFHVMFGGYRNRGDMWPFLRPRRNSYVSEPGTFEIDIPVGWYRFRVSTDDGLASRLHEVHIRDGVEPPALDIPLMQGVAIRGTVRTPDGLAFAATKVKIIVVEGRRKQIVCETPANATGRFEVTGLAPGVYELQVSFANGSDVWLAARTVHLTAHGSEQEVLLDLEVAGRLEVRVEDESGLPIAGAMVKVHEEDGGEFFFDYELIWFLCRRKHRPVEPTLIQWQAFWDSLYCTLRNGNLQPLFLRPRDYVLEVSAEGFTSNRVPVRITAGSVKEMAIQLSRP